MIRLLISDDTATITIDDPDRRNALSNEALAELGKAAFHAVEDMDVGTALDHLHVGLTTVASTEDAQEGVEAFLEKREPQWRGR